METNALDAIRQQINAGDRQEARTALVEFLDAEPDNADAWALLAILLTHPAEQARCYREILRINPGDRQAELWLKTLAGTPAVPEPSTWPCPRCGEILDAGDQQGAHGERMTVCPYCGFHVKPPDAPEDQEQPGLSSGPDAEELVQLLESVSLPGDESEHPVREPVTPQRSGERRGFLDGLLGRRRESTSKPSAEELVLGEAELAKAAGALSPDVILRLAGGPLAPHERRNCPQCNAVVSRRDSRCPWCSAPLSDAKAER